MSPLFAWERRLGPDEVLVSVGSPVSVELPRLAHFLDQVEIHVADEQLFLVRVADIADELPTRIHEVRLPVEIVLAEVLLDPDAVDRPDVIPVRDRVRHLLDTPQVLTQPT